MKYSKRKDKYCCNVLNDNFHEIDSRLNDLEENGGGGGGGSTDVDYSKIEFDTEEIVVETEATTLDILDSLEEIEANTESGKIAGALAVKELDESLGAYSAEEKAVGTWINGKTIYRKSYSESGLSKTSTVIIDAELNSNVVDQVIKYEGSTKCGDSHFSQRDAYSDKAYNAFFRVKNNGLNLDIGNYTVTSYAITVYYTKVE